MPWIKFIHDRVTCWTATSSRAPLLSYGAISYRLQPGDRIFWSLEGHAHSSMGMMDTPVSLYAWLESASGSTWRFLNLELDEGTEPAYLVRDRLLVKLEALARAAEIPLGEAEDIPSQSRLVGTVQQRGVSRGKTIAAWNGVPCDSPFFTLSVAGLDEAVQVCPGWGPSYCLTTEPDDAELVAVHELLASSLNETVVVTGRWSALRVVEPDLPDQPRQRPIQLIEPIQIPQLLPALDELAAADVLPEPAEAPAAPARVWQTIEPRVFFWCIEARRLTPLQPPHCRAH